MKIATIIGARPQFIKASTVSRVIAAHNTRISSAEQLTDIQSQITDNYSPITETIIYTGKHFEADMSDIFFKELGIPEPDYHLGVSGGGHGHMTGVMLEKLEPLLQEIRPDRVLVYGDTNSTLAGALAAAKLHIPVAHVEAGWNRLAPPGRADIGEVVIGATPTGGKDVKPYGRGKAAELIVAELTRDE